MNSTLKTRAHVDAPLSDKALQHLFAQAKQVEACFLTKVALAATSGKDRQARRLLTHYLDSFYCRLAALREANAGCKLAKRLALHSLPREAKRLSLRLPCEEPAVVWNEWKESGGFRILFDFGPLNRARQLMVAKGLRAMHSHMLEAQYAIQGGRDACASALVARVEEGTTKFAMEVDVKNFFGSIEPARLRKEIGLPNRVIDCVVSADAYRMLDKTSCLNAALKRREGIPQGSLCSPLIAAIVISRVLRTCNLPCSVNYADNVCLLARSEDELRVQKTALIAALKSSPFGPLGVHLKPTVAQAEGIVFLGYHMRKTEYGIEVAPSDKAVMSIAIAMVKLAKKMRGQRIALKTVYRTICNRLNRWQQGYRIATIFKHSLWLERFADYISRKPIKNVAFQIIVDRYERWSIKLDRALCEREPLGLRNPILHERAFFDIPLD